MKITLAYGKTGLPIELPDSPRIRVVEPRFQPGLPDPQEAVRRALESPIGAPPLRTRVKAGDTVGIVFSDITRPMPYPQVLPALLEELRAVPDHRIVLFNATGTHRANTAEELEGILGRPIAGRFRIVQNDARDADAHIRIGRTSRGLDVWVHRELMACDVRIPTGFIEPHFFAGFSGGGKAIVPGLAGLETILQNHGAAHLDHPQTRWGVTHGNPLWEEIQEAAALASPTFLLNVTLNRHKEITGVYAGDFRQAHERGCAAAKETAMVAVEEPFDIVIGSNSGFPLDLNLYQSVKGMSAAAEVVRQGGSIVMAADCWDGIPGHGEYGRLLREARDPAALLELARSPGLRRQDLWQVHIQALVSRKADIWFYSRNLTDDQVRAAHLRPCRSIEQTVSELLRRYGPTARICVLPEGPQTIPYIAEAGGGP
jgi:nickel-dependent lactate racemase